MDEDLKRCVKSLDENKADVRYKAQQALLDICYNVLKSPHDDKSRELRLDNEIVIEKLLPAVGAMECLFDIGYIEVCSEISKQLIALSIVIIKLISS
jgi:peptide-N4-(N-acetyl-beta-glucosaminyl)asparagine amidase